MPQTLRDRALEATCKAGGGWTSHQRMPRIWEEKGRQEYNPSVRRSPNKAEKDGLKLSELREERGSVAPHRDTSWGGRALRGGASRGPEPQLGSLDLESKRQGEQPGLPRPRRLPQPRLLMRQNHARAQIISEDLGMRVLCP